MAKNAVNEDEESRKHSNKALLFRLLSYLSPFKGMVVIILILLIIVMLISLINPYLMQTIIDNYIGNNDVKGLIIIAVVMVILNAVALLASRIRIILMSKVTNKMLLNIRQELFAHIQKLSFNFFDNRPVGKILARVIWDVNSLQALFESSITILVPESLTFISVLVLMFIMNVKLAVASVLTLPLVVLSLSGIQILSRKKWESYRKKRSNLNAFTHEALSGVRITQTFAKESYKADKFSEIVSEMMDSFIGAIKLNDLFWPTVEFCWGAGTLVVFWASYGLIIKGEVSIGTMVAFSLYLSMFWRPVMNISNFYNTLVTNFNAAERIFEIMDIKPVIVDAKHSKPMPTIKGEVEFSHVDFGYDEEGLVLNDVSFKVNPGETIALVGPTGAGKTTIVNLLSRFYDTKEGSVLIDGIDIKNVELASLRSQMGIMLQDTFLFSDTIRENIRYGKLDASDDEVEAAAKAVSAHEFIMKLENGYDTQINERGARLSVGQRQLISFARALLANPRILILDEATSNIDTYTERLVQTGIRKLLQGRTSFVIAHRLSTIRDCSRIMVIDDGRIVEAGNHDELISNKGLYYDLYMSQYRFLNEGA